MQKTCTICQWEIEKGPYFHFEYRDPYFHKACLDNLRVEIEELMELRQRFYLQGDDCSAAMVTRFIRAAYNKCWPRPW